MPVPDRVCGGCVNVSFFFYQPAKVSLCWIKGDGRETKFKILRKNVFPVYEVTGKS